MTEPLDHQPTSKPEQKPIFSYMAIIMAIIIILLVVVNVMTTPVDDSIGAMFREQSLTEKALKYAFILSISFTILTFTSKEKSKLKWLALGSMLVASLVFVGMLYYFRKLAGG